MKTFILDWLLGSLIVIPVVAVVCGAIGYGVFALIERRTNQSNNNHARQDTEVADDA